MPYYVNDSIGRKFETMLKVITDELKRFREN